MNEEIKTLVTMLRHVRMVQKYLGQLAHCLEERATAHDLSKLGLDEFGEFVEINRIARTHAYGSEEYNKSLQGNQAIALHFSRNSHHPEHYPGGVADMSLLDIIEMVIDWKAANETYGKPSWEEALAHSQERHKLTPEQMYLIRLIARELD